MNAPVDVVAILRQSAELLRNEAGRSESTGLHIAAAEAEEARAAVAELVEAGKELIAAQQYYDEIDAPGGHHWDRLCAARSRHAAALARVGGAK